MARNEPKDYTKWRDQSYWDTVKPISIKVPGRKRWTTDSPPDDTIQGLTEQHAWAASQYLDMSTDTQDYAALNTQFTNEMWGWYDKYEKEGTIGALYDEDYSAEQLDSMGLDVVRIMTDTGEKNGNIIDKDHAKFYETATRGKVDWDFYKDSNAFQQAYKDWGRDLDNKEGITSIEEIRALNPTAWKQAQREGQDEACEPTFKYDEAPKYEPQELSISYKTRRDPIQHPTRLPQKPHSITNVAKVLPNRPTNLPKSFG